MFEPETKTERVIGKIIQVIISCKNQSFSIITAGWLAKKVGMTPPNLSRAFKKTAKRTLQEFLIMEKIKRAYPLIINRDDLLIEDIATELDYNSTSQFINAFKKYTGIPPGMLRRQYKGKKKDISQKK